MKHPQPKLFDDNGAEFSKCGKCRYSLWRIWDEELPRIMFIGLNPSKATEYINDPTVRRVIGFATDWGYGGVYMMNCFPFVDTNPDGVNEWLLTNDDVNEHMTLNKLRLKEIASKCKDVIFAWGNFKIVKAYGLDEEISKMFPNAHALEINQNGSPKHPLYVRADVVPVLYSEVKIG